MLLVVSESSSCKQRVSFSTMPAKTHEVTTYENTSENIIAGDECEEKLLIGNRMQSATSKYERLGERQTSSKTFVSKKRLL